MTSSKIDSDDPTVCNALVEGIVVNVHPPGRLFLKTSVGDASDTDTGEEFSLSSGADGTPMVHLPSGRAVQFPWASLIAVAKEAERIAEQVFDKTTPSE